MDKGIFSKVYSEYKAETFEDYIRIKISNERNHLSLSGKDKTDKIDDQKLMLICELLRKDSSLIVLDLSHNHISSKGMKSLTELLKFNSSITKINLSHNLIGEDGMKYLSDALEMNSKLIAIDLTKNEFGNKGSKYLLNSISQFNFVLEKIQLEDNKIDFDLKKEIQAILDDNRKIDNKRRIIVEKNLKKTKIIEFSFIFLVRKMKNKKK